MRTLVPLHFILKSVFALSFLRNSPKFYTEKGNAVTKRLCLPTTTPARGVVITAMRGVGCLFLCKAFGDAS